MSRTKVPVNETRRTQAEGRGDGRKLRAARRAEPATHALLAEFGARVRELRLGSGLTQRTLAARIGTDRVYVSYVEHGRRDPSLTTIFRLAAALEADPADLLAHLKRA